MGWMLYLFLQSSASRPSLLVFCAVSSIAVFRGLAERCFVAQDQKPAGRAEIFNCILQPTPHSAVIVVLVRLGTSGPNAIHLFTECLLR